MTLAGFLLAATSLLPGGVAASASHVFVYVAAALIAVAGAVLVWHVEPCYTLSAAIVLTPLAGNWQELGIPGPAAPDRLLFLGGIAAVLFRAPGIRDRPRLRPTAVHWVLGIATLYVVVSAFAAGTLFDRGSFLIIVDTFGIIPFLTFLVAPVAFATERQRRVLLTALVALGAYLGIIVMLETAHANALIFPKYIVDPNYGIHVGRGRGPFVDAVANGLALFTCAAAAAIAASMWKRPAARALAIGVGCLCLIGSVLTLERSVWIGVGLGTAVAMLATTGFRRWFVPLLVAVTAGMAIALVAIPGLDQRLNQRAGDKGTVWDRQNLLRAGYNMVEARPLFGFGWDRFRTQSLNYFQQSPNFPLTATGADLHSTPLTYATTLGLVGVTIWAFGLLLGIGRSLAPRRGPPDLYYWRMALLAVATAFIVVINAVPPTAWPNRSVWLLAGVVGAGQLYRAREERSGTSARAPRGGG